MTHREALHTRIEQHPAGNGSDGSGLDDELFHAVNTTQPKGEDNDAQF